MNKADKLKAKLLAGQGYHNFSFSDLATLLKALGFVHDRTTGSHHWFKHPRIAEPVNIQPVHGQAKPYQLTKSATSSRNTNYENPRQIPRFPLPRGHRV